MTAFSAAGILIGIAAVFGFVGLLFLTGLCVSVVLAFLFALIVFAGSVFFTHKIDLL